MSFIKELKRRNVLRVAVAYVLVAWLSLQVSDTLVPALHLPEWFHSGVALFLILGFPLALIFAWAYEMTPEGLKKEKDVDRSASVTHVTGRKLDFAIITALVLALAYFVYDDFVIEPTLESDSAPEVIATDGKHSIAVIPFVNMSSDPEQEYFSDGLSEEILNLLARIPELKVIARTSSFAFKGKNDDMRVIGEALGVKTLLEGSVRKSGDRVRITAQLIDVVDGAHLWSETYDRTMTDIFAVQDDVAAAIIDALQIHVGTNPTRGRPTDNTEAYTLFLKARALVRDPYFEIDELLLRAIELDPKFAKAYELLAYKLWTDSEQQQAREVAAEALAIDPDLVLAQAVYEATKIGIGLRLTGVEAFERAVREQPNNPDLLQPLIWNLTQAGYLREALRLSQRWIDIDPLSVTANVHLEFTLVAVGRIDESLVAAERADQLSGSVVFHDMRGVMALEARQDEKAIAHFEAYLRNGGETVTSRVRELITNGRDPVTGQAYLDRHIPDLIAGAREENRSQVQRVLYTWYFSFGFLDRFFELLFEIDLDNSRWTPADELLFDGVVHRRTGFTAHPKFLEVADALGIIEIWEKRGPPDFCDKVGDQWVCE
jgi:TolB-like protein